VYTAGVDSLSPEEISYALPEKFKGIYGKRQRECVRERERAD
jgi:hypothetical protein